MVGENTAELAPYFSQLFANNDALLKAVERNTTQEASTGAVIEQKLDRVVAGQEASAKGTSGITPEDQANITAKSVSEAIAPGNAQVISAITGVGAEFKDGLTAVKDSSAPPSQMSSEAAPIANAAEGTKTEMNRPDETVDTGFGASGPIDVNVKSMAPDVYDNIDELDDDEKEAATIAGGGGTGGSAEGGGGGILGGLGAMLIPLIATKMTGIFRKITGGVVDGVKKLKGFVGKQITKAGDSLKAGWDKLKNSKLGKAVGNTASKAKKKLSSAWGWIKGKASKAKKAIGRGAKHIGTAVKGAGTAVKGAAKGLGKSALKKIPGVGLVAGGIFAAHRLAKGDMGGALMELGSGLASTVPGVGTAVSVGLDAALMGKDMSSKSKKKGDFIVRPGQKPLEFSADDTVIATKSKVPKGMSPAGMAATGVGTAMMLGASQIAAPTNSNLEAEANRISHATPAARVPKLEKLAPEIKDHGEVAQDFISEPGAEVQKIRSGATKKSSFWQKLKSADWKSGLKMMDPMGMVKTAGDFAKDKLQNIAKDEKPDLAQEILKELKGGKMVGILNTMAGDIHQMSNELPEAIASIEPSNNTMIAGGGGGSSSTKGSNITNHRDKHRRPGA